MDEKDLQIERQKTLIHQYQTEVLQLKTELAKVQAESNKWRLKYVKWAKFKNALKDILEMETGLVPIHKE